MNNLEQRFPVLILVAFDFKIARQHVDQGLCHRQFAVRNFHFRDAKVLRRAHLVTVVHRLEGKGLVIDPESAELLFLAHRYLGDRYPAALF